MSYNFDLDTLDLLYYSDVYEKAGFNDDNIEAKVISSIQNNKLYEEEKEHFEKSEIEEHKKDSIKKYKEEAENDEIEYFLGENNTLNVVTTLCHGMGKGSARYVLEIK